MGPLSMKTTNSEENRKCIWMQAGVVRQKHCAHDYECAACRYDRVMRRTARENRDLRQNGTPAAGNRRKIVYWKDRLREMPSWKRPCLHHMKGRIEFRACTHEYQCGDCEFDQYFNDQYTVHAVVRPIDVLDIKGITLPQGYYLHRGHCWARLEADSTVRVGLDDFALHLLGPLDRIEAPLMGKEIRQGRGDIALNRGDNDTQILSPISGVVTDINPRLRDDGSLANKDPYTEGWIMRLHANNLRHDLGDLLIGDQAGDFVDQEVERLYDVIEETTGPLAADGGFLADDIYGNLPQLGWERLTRLFLRS